MIECIFEPTDKTGEHKCVVCGFVARNIVHLPIHRHCPKAAPTAGPGTELKRLLARVGVTVKPNCTCNRRAVLMDVKGVGWCEQSLRLIVGWLREEYDRRKLDHSNAAAAHAADPTKPAPEALPIFLRLPFLEAAARQMVKLAIRNARRAAEK